MRGSEVVRPHCHSHSYSNCNLTLIFAFTFPFPDQIGCSYCNGLGHRITDCPKLASLQNRQTASIGRKDYLSASAADY